MRAVADPLPRDDHEALPDRTEDLSTDAASHIAHATRTLRAELIPIAHLRATSLSVSVHLPARRSFPLHPSPAVADLASDEETVAGTAGAEDVVGVDGNPHLTSLNVLFFPIP